MLYADQWVVELKDFRHVRISLTPEEVKEYSRRCWAYELFLRAGSPRWAKMAPGIDLDIAHDADNYSPTFRNGLKIQPPYHCFAAFLGRHLEAISCGAVRERITIIELQGKEAVLFTLQRAVHALTPIIRSFNSREKGLAQWTISREDDIRDLLYAMLKPILFDLVKEEPTPSIGNTYKIVDLCSKVTRLLIEVKWIGKKKQWKSIFNQILVDIQTYPIYEFCDTLIFVVIDAARDILDPRLLEHEMSGVQTILDRSIDIRLYIVEL